jgi:hypothetical protein
MPRRRIDTLIDAHVSLSAKCGAKEHFEPKQEKVCMESLIYQSSPTVTFATNTFFNVPVILQYEDTPLISVVHEQQLGYTTEIPIYHSDGTYLAKVRGTRIFPTDDGAKSGLVMRPLAHTTVCELNGRTVFEIEHATGDSFKTRAELYTPDGHFLKCTDSIPQITDGAGKPLQIRGVTMTRNRFANVRIGVKIFKDGRIAIGVN